MPCTKPARGTAVGALPPFNDAVDNDPCGKEIVAEANGVDVSAHSLCLPHLVGKLGTQDVQPPYVFAP